MDIIHIGLYGGKGIFGGRETPLEADVIYCDRYKECSYYQSGECRRVRELFGGGCRFGKNQIVKGYTSRAQKYYSFKKQWTDHEKYNKLQSAKQKLGLISDTVVFPYPYISIKKLESGELRVSGPMFGGNTAYIERNQFTSDLINKICKFRPQAMMGGEIRDYQQKTVPLFLAHTKEIMPEKYTELIAAYPEYNKKINHAGRNALLKTINPSQVHYRSDRYPEFNETWEYDGEYLTYVKGYVHKSKITKDYEVVSYKIKPADNSVVTITNNAQVSDKTVFID